MALSWNPGDSSANIVFSNSNLTGTGDGTTQDLPCRSTTSVGNTGKWYWEVSIVSITANSTIVGVANATFTTVNGTWPGVDNNSIGVTTNVGEVWINNSNIAVIANCSAGNRRCVALDLVNKRIWFRTNSGNWNGSSSNDPSTNVGGYDMSALGTGNIFPTVSVYGGSSMTGNFTQPSFANSMPSGFLPADGPALTTIVMKRPKRRYVWR